MTLNWVPSEGNREQHYTAATEFGQYAIGPRASDGAWEYTTPDEDWGDHRFHMLDSLSKDEAMARVNEDFMRRQAKARSEVNG